MSPHPFLGSLWPAILSIGAAVLSLAGLGIILKLWKSLSRARTPESGEPGAEAGSRAPGPPETRRLPDWVLAAAAAYLNAEERTEGPGVEAWPPQVNQYDPWWSAGGKLRKTFGVQR